MKRPYRIVHKIEETRTFEIDVIQQLRIGKLSNLAHIKYLHMVACTNIT